jgi:alpha-galactosidase
MPIRSAACFALFWLCCGWIFAADRSSVTVATGDTRVRLEVRGDKLALVGFESTQTGPNWFHVSEMRLIDTVELNGQKKAIIWKFKTRKSSSLSNRSPAGETFVFESSNPALELKSIWTAYSGPGPVEHQITIRNNGDAPVILPLQPSLMFDAHVAPGRTLENIWVEKGAGRPSANGTHRTKIGKDFSATLISTPYRDEPRDAIPWTAIQDVTGQQGWYAGIEFSGWVEIVLRAASEGTNANGVHAELGLEGGEQFRTQLLPGETFETPSVFIGCYQGDVDNGANQFHRWIESHLRPPVHDDRYPLLVNNSWGSGMAVDEKLARKMIDDSADLGLELFHIDAGWFRGVGEWFPDEKKFPHGLAAVADYAHAKGLKFGLWVGWTQGGHSKSSDDSILSVFNPRMSDWFTHDYKADWRTAEFTGADVCLGDVKAREWCLRTLRRVVKDDKLDLLEHDQRMIVDTCSRQDHLHTSSKTDIAYHATRGYYEVYDALRAENPNLLFENCVNGGHMVDFGVVRRTHYISITDVYDPLSNRQAFYDSSYALPPSMCECYIENHPGTNLANFRYMLRSGMMGWCTIMLDMSKWNAQQRMAAKRQFELYKTELRPLIAHGNLYHVSERPDGMHWDGMQYVSNDASKGVLFAFRGATEEKIHVFKLKGLDTNRRYGLTYEDGTGNAAMLSGKQLVQAGVTLTLPDSNSSELLFFRSKP